MSSSGGIGVLLCVSSLYAALVVLDLAGDYGQTCNSKSCGPLQPLTESQRKSERTSLKYVWNMLQMKGRSYTDTFCSLSDDNCSTVDNYPGYATRSELKFEKVVEELQSTPAREARGEIRRLGDLGYFIFNYLVWEGDWFTFPIGADVEDHRKHRPTADLLMGSSSGVANAVDGVLPMGIQSLLPGAGAWSRSMVRSHVQAFFEGRKTITMFEIDSWVAKLLHKILLDLDISDLEAEEFVGFKASCMKVSVLPGWLVKGVGWAMGLNKVRQQRETWLARYMEAMARDTRNIIPRHQEHRDRRFLADLLLTSMTTAGGISVPTVMHMCLAIVYGGRNSPLPEMERKLTKSNVEPLVLETIRRYPVVVGFPWWSPDQSFRTVMNLAMALRDPQAWGSDAEEFKLRPLSEYHQKAGTGTKIGVAWAEQARGANGLTPDSRGCPGQQLSLVIITEFLHALRPMQSEWFVIGGSPDDIVITEGPSAASDFTLSRRARGNE